VRDPILVVDVARYDETVLFVKASQVKLGANSNRLRAERDAGANNGLPHERPADAGAACLGVAHHAANRRLGESEAGRYETRIADETARFLATEQVQRVPVLSVAIEIGALLLDAEDQLAESEHLIELFHGQLGKRYEVPAEHAAMLGRQSRRW
jgi:hypothetical protein